MLSNKMSDCKLTIPVVSSTGSSGKRDTEIRATSGPTELRIRRSAVKRELMASTPVTNLSGPSAYGL